MRKLIFIASFCLGCLFANSQTIRINKYLVDSAISSNVRGLFMDTSHNGNWEQIATRDYTSGSGGGTNSNVGTGYRLAIPGTNNIKTLLAGTNITIDSATNTLTINSSGSGSSTSPNGYALKFNAATTHGSLYTNSFYADSVHHGNFFFQSWLRPIYPGFDGAGYFLSAGQGGAHNILIGFNFNSSGSYAITGNVYQGAVGTSFSSIDLVPDSTDHYVAVGSDGSYIVVWLDGVITAKVPFTGGRYTYDGDQPLYFGGSDHNRYGGYYFYAQMYEGVCINSTSSPVYPPRFFSGLSGSQLLYDMTRPATQIDDESDGFEGGNHPGILEAVAPSSSSPIWDMINPGTGAPYPNYNSDAWADSLLPQFVPATLHQFDYGGPAPSVGVGAKVWDQFRRKDALSAWRNLHGATLDTTEGGSLGRLKYTEPNAAHGIINQAAWFDVTAGAEIYATVNSGSNDDSIVITRNTSGSNAAIIVGRVSNASNRVQVMSDGGTTTYLQTIIAGVTTNVASATTTSGYSSMALVLSGSNARVYQNGALLINTTSVSGVPSSNNMGFGAIDDLVRITKFAIY